MFWPQPRQTVEWRHSSRYTGDASLSATPHWLPTRPRPISLSGPTPSELAQQRHVRQFVRVLGITHHTTHHPLLPPSKPGREMSPSRSVDKGVRGEAQEAEEEEGSVLTHTSAAQSLQQSTRRLSK